MKKPKNLSDLLDKIAMFPSISKRPRIIAHRIAGRYCDIAELPVPINEIISSLGIEVKNYFPDSVQLAVAQTDIHPPTITLHSHLEPYDRRFALAHSFGHVVLHPPGQYIDSTYSGSIEESQANEFAAHLIMPQHTLGLLLISKHPPNQRELTALFQMPEHMVYKRLMQALGFPVWW